MKLRLVSVVLALVVPLVGCNTSGTSNSSPDSAQSPTTESSTTSAVESPTTQSSTTSAVESPTTESSTTATNNWYSYTSQDKTYTAKFPASPQEKKQTINSTEFLLVTYSDNKKQRSYLTNTYNIAIGQNAKSSDFDVEKYLDAARDGSAKTAKATVTNETKITKNGYPGREITMRGNNMTMIQRLFIDPKVPKLYQAVVTSTNGEPNSPEDKAFLDSLTINK